MKAPGDGDGITPVPGFLRPIDVGAIARDLRLAQRGKERGASNLPPLDTQALDGPEQDIVQKLESELGWHAGQLLNHLRSYASRLAQYSIDSEFARLKIVGDDAATTLRGASHRAEADLGPLRELFVDTRQELNAFKARHRLVRPPRDPSNRWTSFGLLFVIVAFESVLNGLFFAKGSSGGIVGGIGTAIGISVVNVAFAFLLGLWPARWLHHKNFMLKLVGLVLLAGGLVSLVALHGFAAHLRDATALVGEDEAMKKALEALRVAPLSLSDLNSYYLFGLGAVFALLALLKGYSFDDPYPSYGSVFRRFAAARDKYSDAHADLFEDLEDIKAKAVDDLTNGIARLPTFPQMASNIRAQRLAMIEQFRTFERGIAVAINQLLALYRDANMEARNSSTPVHFQRSYELSTSVLASPEAVSLMAEAEPSQANIGDMLGALGERSRIVLDEYEKLLSAYPHPTQIDIKADGQTG